MGVLTTPMDAILASLIHMSVNRLLSSAQRANHMLARLYEGRLGRARTSGKNTPIC